MNESAVAAAPRRGNDLTSVHSRLENIIAHGELDDILNEIRDNPFFPSDSSKGNGIVDRLVEKGVMPLLYYEQEGVVVFAVSSEKHNDDYTADELYTDHLSDLDTILPAKVHATGIDSTTAILYFCSTADMHKLKPYVVDPQEVFAFYRNRQDEEFRQTEQFEGYLDTTAGSEMLEKIICKAIKIGASDIHIETNHGNYRIRFRIDGTLVVNSAVHQKTGEEIDKVSYKSYKEVVGALKAKAEGITHHKKMLPQNGKYEVAREVLDKHRIHDDYQFRVATVPTPYGEDVVIRIHEKGRPMPLQELGFLPEIIEQLGRLAKSPHGIILACGPTGSGKTTTLYSMIEEVNHSDVKIITMEYPIERDIMGLEQIQINPEIGLTFAACTSATLRLDPDILLIGEMKDNETAYAAIQAALTGHLVYSSLHTNDAPSSILRLIRMLPDGSEIDLQATLRAIVAQRLIRKLNLLESHEEDQAAELTRLTGIDFGYPIRLYCPNSLDSNLSFKGRIPVGELFVITDEVRDKLIQKDYSISTFKRIASEQGMVTLFECGLRRVIDHTTSLSEVVDLVGEDEFRLSAKLVKHVFDTYYHK